MISVHRFTQGGLFFAVDGGSASIHQLDEVAYELLGLWLKLAEQAGNSRSKTACQELFELFEGWRTWIGAEEDGARFSWWQAHQPLYHACGLEAVREAGSELLDLVDQGLLFADDSYLDELVGPEVGSQTLKAICLNVSHDCDLRCRYCFAGTGAFGGQRLNMSAETARRAIDFLLENSPGRERVEVDFFGGEPLLNLPVVKETVAYGEKQAAAKGKEIRFTLTTNGMLLDAETAAYLNDNMFNLVLSLDGRPEVNDRMRLSLDGTSVYNTILPRFQEIAELRGDRQYYVRGTYTAYNKDFFEDVRHLVEVGFDRVSVEPVVADPQRPYALKVQDLPELFHQYELLADYYCELYPTSQRFEFYHFNLSLLQGQCLSKRLTGCGAGGEYLAVTPNGDIYPCHQFVGREEYRLGNLIDSCLDEGIQRTFRRAHVLAKQDCRGCWARFFCSGGCHANAVSANGDIYKPDHFSCELLKKRLECSIYIQARLLALEEADVDNLEAL
ncbi:MAG: thioether cross-link-forming SCIFF peptide maturase [Firmicutes bacterium]|nr:thioether cross-link-forming SCIFF peptide maturase [Bacillota bacterium]